MFLLPLKRDIFLTIHRINLHVRVSTEGPTGSGSAHSHRGGSPGTVLFTPKSHLFPLFTHRWGRSGVEDPSMRHPLGKRKLLPEDLEVAGEVGLILPIADKHARDAVLQALHVALQTHRQSSFEPVDGTVRQSSFEPVDGTNGWLMRWKWRSTAASHATKVKGDAYFQTPCGALLRSIADARRWMETGGARDAKAEKARKAAAKAERADNKALEALEAKEHKVWVQCDKCDKWRQLPPDMNDRLADDAEWFCEMHPDVELASCDVPDESSGEAWEVSAAERKHRATRALAEAAAAGIALDTDGKGRYPLVLERLSVRGTPFIAAIARDVDGLLAPSAPLFSLYRPHRALGGRLPHTRLSLDPST